MSTSEWLLFFSENRAKITSVSVSVHFRYCYIRVSWTPYIFFTRVDNTRSPCTTTVRCARRMRIAHERGGSARSHENELITTWFESTILFERIVYLLLSTNKIFLYTSEPNSLVCYYCISVKLPSHPVSLLKFYLSSLFINPRNFAFPPIFPAIYFQDDLKHFIINLSEFIFILNYTFLFDISKKY